MEITDKDYLAWARAERAGVIRWWLVRGGGAFPQYQLRYRSASTAMLTVGIRILEKRRDGSSRVVREAEIELVPESLVDPMEWDAFSKAYQCDAVRPFYADRIDQMLARWSDPTFQISPTTIIDATDTSRCEHQSITHIGIVSDQVYSEKHKGASYGDWPITLQYFQSLARHLHLSDTEFLILGEDGPLLIQESLLPIFLNSGMQQQDLLVPNFHSLARFMRGTLMEEHVRCKGGCYGQRKPTMSVIDTRCHAAGGR